MSWKKFLLQVSIQYKLTPAEIDVFLCLKENEIQAKSVSRCKLFVDGRGRFSSRNLYANSQPLILGTSSFRINQTNSALENQGFSIKRQVDYGD